MVRVSFTQNIQRHVACPTVTVCGQTVKEVLSAAFSLNEKARDYVLDESGAVRRHMVIFVNGEPIRDRQSLTDSVPEGAEVHVMQALSGG